MLMKAKAEPGSQSTWMCVIPCPPLQAVLWDMDTLSVQSVLEEHSMLVTDVRFSPNSTRLATSSFDKTVRVWDVDHVSGCRGRML